MKRSALLAVLCVIGLAPKMLLVADPVAVGADPGPALKICMQQDDDARRLTCYDQALERKRGQAADFGMTSELIRKKQAKAGVVAPSGKEKITAKVVKVARQGNGRFVVTLDSGQAWLQTETLDFPIQEGDSVEIEPGVLGGIWLSLPARKIKSHVKRIE